MQLSICSELKPKERSPLSHWLQLERKSWCVFVSIDKSYMKYFISGVGQISKLVLVTITIRQLPVIVNVEMG